MMDGTGATAGDGVIKFAYANSTGKLRPHTIRRDLHFYSVTGCAGLFVTGDPISVTGVFIVSPNKRSPARDTGPRRRRRRGSP